MATRLWDGGAADGDLGTAANWTADTLPTTGDTVAWISDYDGVTPVSVGGADLAAVEPAKVLIGEGYTQNVGATAQDIDFNLVSGPIEHRGSGKYWAKMGGGTSVSLGCISTNSSPSADVLNITGATLTRAGILRGAATVDASGTVANVDVGYLNSPATDATVTLAAGATITTVNIAGGRVTSGAAITTCYVAGGVLTQSTNTITTLIVFGGDVIFNTAGTITTLVVFGGRVYLDRAGGLKTVTNLTQYGGEIRGRDNALVTITNDYKYGGE